MITQSDIEREKYEARLKYQFDENNWNAAMRREKERGKHVGLIQAYERILQRPATPEEQLSAMSPEDLTRLAAELEKQALSRG